MASVTITDKDFSNVQDRGEFLKSKGVPMVIKEGSWTFDPEYIVSIDEVSQIGSRGDRVFVYKWFKA